VRGLFRRPLMPYTRGLLNSVPRLVPLSSLTVPLEAIPGNVPDPANLPPGCAFSPRCGHMQPDLCEAALPVLDPAGPEHLVRCARWRDLAA